MKILNGYEIIDLSTRELIPDELNPDILPTDCLQLLMDGTTDVLDLVNLVAATKTGGVAGAWTEESNFQNVKLCKAPVIAEATDNLLADEDASFEGGTAGRWTDYVSDHTASFPADNTAFHGSDFYRATCAGGTRPAGYADITDICAAGSQYTFSCYIRAGNAGAVGTEHEIYLVGNASGATKSNVVTLTTEWQLLKVTHTFAAGDTTYRRAYHLYNSNSDGQAGDIIDIDGLQIEAKAYATPFALDSRTACTLKYATADLGLTAGQDISIVCVTKTPWAGNDGVNHTLFETRESSADYEGIIVRKMNTDNLEVVTRTSGGSERSMGLAVNGTNWAADTTHVIIATVTGTTLGIYLDGTAGAVSGGSANRETTFGTNTRVGIAFNDALQANAPILVAIFDRVLSAQEIAYISKMGAWFPAIHGVVR